MAKVNIYIWDTSFMKLNWGHAMLEIEGDQLIDFRPGQTYWGITKGPDTGVMKADELGDVERGMLASADKVYTCNLSEKQVDKLKVAYSLIDIRAWNVTGGSFFWNTLDWLRGKAPAESRFSSTSLMVYLFNAADVKLDPSIDWTAEDTKNIFDTVMKLYNIFAAGTAPISNFTSTIATSLVKDVSDANINNMRGDIKTTAAKIASAVKGGVALMPGRLKDAITKNNTFSDVTEASAQKFKCK